MKLPDTFLENESLIKLNKKLPAPLTTPTAGEHLYMIGAAYYWRDAATTRRYRLHRPGIFLPIIGFIFARTVAILCLPPQYDELLIWIGDVSTIVNLKFHVNILLITFDYIIVFCHALHYVVLYRYRTHGIRPNSAPFDLAAGLITPKSVGLLDRHKVFLLANFTKWSLNSCFFLTRYLMNAFVGFAFTIVSVLKMSAMQSWLIWPVNCFWIGLWTVKSHIFFTYLFYHMLYFDIICFYLRLKIAIIINSIYGRIEMLCSRKRRKGRNDAANFSKKPLKLYFLLRSLQDIWKEIRQFNGSFWSYFIFCVWSAFTVNISMFLYTAIFGVTDTTVRVIACLVLTLEIFSVSALCLIASSVNKKARQLYVALNSLNTKVQRSRDRNKLKFAFSMEHWSSKKIGFTCGSFFPLNYFAFYEMIALIATFFLKLVQME